MTSIREFAAANESKARILVCDDAASLRSMMAMVLGRRYSLKLTASAEEAFQVAPEFSPDLIITDHLLPGITGKELVQKLRAIPAFEEVPIILLTAVGDADARAEGIEAGADEYLVKPIRERELLARVASLLRLRRTLLALSRRSRELEDANGALQAAQARLLRAERLAGLGSLAAALAHDINNPLALIKSGAAALLSITEDAARRAEPLDPQRSVALLAELRAIGLDLTEGSRRIEGVGRDLGLFSAGNKGLPARVRAEDPVRSAMALATSRAADPPPIEISVVGAPELDAPQHLVTLALLSILDRAVLSAGPHGHVRVDVATAGQYVSIAIRDDGPSIPIALLPRVFEPFVRLHPAHQAVGLGLSVAAGIVQGLGGHIDVDGALTAGACFRVQLPIAAS
jgi:signal transduction histidine kinase